MNKFFEKVTQILGSTPVIGLFGLWMLIHTFMGKEYLSFISEMAIWLGFLILRGQNIQADRAERMEKRDLRKSDKIIGMLEDK